MATLPPHGERADWLVKEFGHAWVERTTKRLLRRGSDARTVARAFGQTMPGIRAFAKRRGIALVYQYAFVYALCDPRGGEVRYVGVTVDPEGRYEDHLWYQGILAMRPWLEELFALNLYPEMRILARVPYRIRFRAERALLRKHSASGLLFNIAGAKAL